MSSKINFYILQVGILTAILSSTLSFILSKNKNSSSSKPIFISLFVFILLIGLTIFLSKDLAGQGSCKKKNNAYEFVCKSQITKMKLPSYFCENELLCECVLDSDCPSACNNCKNTICTPGTGHREMITNQQRRPNIPVSVFAILSALILGALCISKNRNGNKMLNILIVVFVLVEIGFTVANITKNYSSIVPISVCSSS